MLEHFAHFAEQIRRPFIDLFSHEGPQDFPQEYVVLISAAEQRGLLLSPLFIWGLGALTGLERGDELYLLDKYIANAGELVYNPVPEGDELDVGDVADLAGLRSQVDAFLRGDAQIAFSEGLVLRSRRD